MKVKLSGGLRQGGKKLLLVLVSLAVVVTSSWASEGLGGGCLLEIWLGSCHDDPPIILGRALAAVAGFGFSTWIAYLLAKDFLPIQYLAHDEHVRDHRALIAAISPLKGRYEKQDDGALRVINPEKASEFVRLSGDIDTDIRVLHRPNMALARSTVPACLTTPRSSRYRKRIAPRACRADRLIGREGIVQIARERV